MGGDECVKRLSRGPCRDHSAQVETSGRLARGRRIRMGRVRRGSNRTLGRQMSASSTRETRTREEWSAALHRGLRRCLVGPFKPAARYTSRIHDTDAATRGGLMSTRTETLSRLRGTFALIVWDDGSTASLLRRGPVGNQPLFYARATGRNPPGPFPATTSLAPRGLARSSIGRPSSITSAIAGPTRETHSAVRRVPVAHALVWRGAASRSSYWELSTPEAWIDDDETG